MECSQAFGHEKLCIRLDFRPRITSSSSSNVISCRFQMFSGLKAEDLSVTGMVEVLNSLGQLTDLPRSLSRCLA